MTERSDPQLDRWLAQLERRAAPPPELEERVVAALRERRLLRPAQRRPAAWRFALAASLAATFLLGTLIGRWSQPWIDTSPGPAASSARYLLLLSEPSPLETDKSLPELVSEYAAWAHSLSEQGHLLAAERLTDRTRRLGAAAPQTAPITGFFLLAARDWEEASRLATTCPHLAYGGAITLREVASSGEPVAGSDL